MDRREFFKKSIQLGAAAGAAALIGKTGMLFGEEKVSAGIEMAAVRGGEPDALFDAGMKAFGGMGSFVKKGQTVLLKPNIGWNQPPEMAANTNPLLVSQIIKHCLEAGAKKVLVFDHSCDYWESCYKTSGIEKAVKEAGGVILPGGDYKYYQEVKIPGAKVLKTAHVHEALLEADVFINAPVLKSHFASQLTIGMKNLMGVVWDRDFWHSNFLSQCIADFAKFRKPNLTVVDAYAVMTRYGPRGTSTSDVAIKKNLLIATDMVLADAAAAKIFGMAPEDVVHIKLANDQNIGNMNTEGRNIQRIAV